MPNSDAYVPGRWDERIKAMRQLELRHGRRDWHREPQAMSVKAEPETPTLENP